MNTGAELPYIMEDPREADRLVAKVEPDAWVARFILPHLVDAMTVLDVGCGPGHLTGAVARCGRRVQVIGVDRSMERLAEARRRHAGSEPIEFKQGSARELPLADGSVDFAYCRFVLEYLSDPAAAVRELARVVRPGGRILLQDLDGQLLWHHPLDEALSRDLEKVLGVLARTGFDPFIGRKLFHLAHIAGLVEVSIAIEPYHLIAGRASDEQLRQWQTKLEIALPYAHEALGSRVAAENLRDRFLEYLRRGDTFTYCSLVTAIAKKPAHCPLGRST